MSDVQARIAEVLAAHNNVYESPLSGRMHCRCGANLGYGGPWVDAPHARVHHQAAMVAREIHGGAK